MATDLRIKIRTNRDGVPSVVRDEDNPDGVHGELSPTGCPSVASTVEKKRRIEGLISSLTSKRAAAAESLVTQSSLAESCSDSQITVPADEVDSTLDSSLDTASQLGGTDRVRPVPNNQMDEDTMMFGLETTDEEQTQDAPLTNSATNLDSVTMASSVGGGGADGSQPATPSTATGGSGSFRRSRTDPSLQLSRVVCRIPQSQEVQTEDVFEYRWPAEDVDVDAVGWKDREPDWFVVQEVISEFLKVKSFKRKYPELTRRPIDSWEKSWLMQRSLVVAGQADMGLTALRSDEVMVLLERDYPNLHTRVSSLFHERRIQRMRDRQKEQYQTSRVERGTRLEQTRQKALKSTTEFNQQLVRERRKERRYYWDLQTMQIHIPRPPPTGVTNSRVGDGGRGFYPVALIPGQFAERAVAYTPDELGYLPLNRCLYSLSRRRTDAVTPAAACPTPVQILPRPSTPGRPASTGSGGGPSNTGAGGASSGAGGDAGGGEGTATGGAAPSGGTEQTALTGEPGDGLCSVCKEAASEPIRCSDCQRSGHPKCLELPDNMVDVVRTYAWSCMDCKKCVECLDPGHEELMMFCDRCDRGYHAFCVGLAGIPEGQWECPSCAPDSPEDYLPLAKVRKTVRGRRTVPGVQQRKVFQTLD